MTLELIGIIALLVGVISIFLESSFIVYAFFCATLLGSAAAFVLTSLGGTNISPAHLLLGFLTFKLLSNKSIAKQAIEGISPGRPGFWLLLTAIYSAVSAFFMPRIFAGQTYVFAVRAESAYSIPLAPAMSNLTQSIYFIADFICFFVLCGYASQPGGKRTLGRAALFCAALNLAFAALDLITYWTNTTELLSFIRNANYSLLNDTELAGFKRIVGSFIEASSFGAATLGYFAFTNKLWLLGIRPYLTLTLSLLSLFALVFSTSTTAFVGLAAFLIFTYIEILARAARKTLTSQMVLFLFGAPVILAIVVIMIALNDASSAYVQGILNEIVFNKMSTDSGVERSSWNARAMQNFYDTFGFGAGNGSVRASSFPIAVLASLGIIGSLIFGLFFLTLFLSRTATSQSNPKEEAYRQAAKSVCVAWLITSTASGALTDLGLPFFVFAALACSVAAPVHYKAYKKFENQRLFRPS